MNRGRPSKPCTDLQMYCIRPKSEQSIREANIGTSSSTIDEARWVSVEDNTEQA